MVRPIAVVLAAFNCATGAGCAPSFPTAPTTTSPGPQAARELVNFSGAIVGTDGQPIGLGQGAFVIRGGTVAAISYDAMGNFSGQLWHRPGEVTRHSIWAESLDWEGPSASVTVANGAATPTPVVLKLQRVETVEFGNGPIVSAVPTKGAFPVGWPFTTIRIGHWPSAPITLAIESAAGDPLIIDVEAHDSPVLPEDYPYENLSFSARVKTVLVGGRQRLTVAFPPNAVYFGRLRVSSATSAEDYIPLDAPLPFTVTPITTSKP